MLLDVRYLPKPQVRRILIRWVKLKIWKALLLISNLPQACLLNREAEILRSLNPSKSFNQAVCTCTLLQNQVFTKVSKSSMRTPVSNHNLLLLTKAVFIVILNCQWISKYLLCYSKRTLVLTTQLMNPNLSHPKSITK